MSNPCLTLTDFIDPLIASLTSQDAFAAIASGIFEHSPGVSYGVFYADGQGDALEQGDTNVPSGTFVINDPDQALACLVSHTIEHHCLDGDAWWYVPLLFDGAAYGMVIIHEPGAALGGTIDEDWCRDLSRIVSPTLVKNQLYEDAALQAQRHSAKLDALLTIGTLLKNLELDVLVAKLMDVMLGLVHAQVGNIALNDHGVLKTTVEFGLDAQRLLQFKNSKGEPWAEVVVREGQAQFFLDAAQHEDLDTQSVQGDVCSVVFMPLVTNTGCHGVVTLVNGLQQFEREDIETLETVSRLASAVVENAVLHEHQMEVQRLKGEMQLAQSIQDDLQADAIPELPGLDIAGWTQPCDETGGDYYDFITHGESSVDVIVGDASGHGLPAALMMVNVRSSFLTLLQEALPWNDVFERVNERVVVDNGPSRFMTLIGARIDATERTMTYCSAGHDSPLWYRPSSDTFTELDATGIPLGMMEGMEYEVSEALPMTVGDVVLFATDGIWESRNVAHEFYGRERLEAVLRDHREESSHDIAEHIRRDVLAFTEGEPMYDDMTLVIVRVV